MCESVLKNHVKTHDPINSDAQCPHCPKTASSIGNLNRHIRSVHFEFSDKKQFICRTDNCGKNFKDPSALRIHEKIHTGERPFQCGNSGCQKKFMTNAQLKIHMVITYYLLIYVLRLTFKIFSIINNVFIFKLENSYWRETLFM